MALFSAQAPPIEIGRSAQREHEPERAGEPDEDDRAATEPSRGKALQVEHRVNRFLQDCENCGVKVSGELALRG